MPPAAAHAPLVHTFHLLLNKLFPEGLGPSDKAIGEGQARTWSHPGRAHAHGKWGQARAASSPCPVLSTCSRKNQDLRDEHFLMPRATLQPRKGSKPAAATHKGGFSLRKLLLQGMDPTRCPKHSSALPMSHTISLPRASVSPPASLALDSA